MQVFNLQEREKEGEPKMNDTRAAGREVGAGAAADRQAWFTLVEADRASETRVLEGRPSCCDTAEEEERWAEVWARGRSSVCLAERGGRRRENWLDGQTDADGLSCRRRSMLGLAGFPIAPDRASLPPLSQTIPRLDH